MNSPICAKRAPAAPVLVIGDVMLDIVAAPQSEIEIGTDTPAQIRLLPGGSGANQAAWLGHFGIDVMFVSRVGAASHDEHAAALRRCGVQPLLARDDQVRTGMLVTLVGADGERSFLTDRGANAYLCRADLPDALLERVGLVHVSGYALFAPEPRRAVLDFLAAATRHGIPITVDPGSASFVRAVGPAAFLQWTSMAQVCFPNVAEAAILACCADRGEQLARLANHYATVVITCGQDGACAAANAGNQRWFEPALREVPLDTSGAGDAFVGAFLAALVQGKSLARCLQRGVAGGTQAVGHYGGRPPSPGNAT